MMPRYCVAYVLGCRACYQITDGLAKIHLFYYNIFIINLNGVLNGTI